MDALFEKIYEFGKTCKDGMDFETKFASSPLNQEYINMFTKVAQKCKAKEIAHVENNVKSTGEQIMDDVGSDARYLARELSMPARRKARMEMDSKMRNTPLGKIEQANNTFWLFKRLKGKVSRKKTDADISDESANN